LEGGSVTASRALSAVPDVPPAPVKLSLQGVSKGYTAGSGVRIAALEDVTFDVRAGEFVCLIGPSGCGKSSILNLLAGLERPDRGEVLLDGRPVEGPGPDRALLFQDPALFPWLTVRGNVEYALRLRGLGREEIGATADRWLAKVHLTAFADVQPHELSGGMRHRAALARALACQPEVLLADEPFGALDAQSREILQKELVEVWAELGNTFVFVTHNVREAAFLADRVIVLSARPGIPIAEYRITTPRPRSFEDVLLAKVVVDIHDHLAKEVERAASEEGLRPGLA
jgi:NitT/TauT family transport system ATP-binding protein